MFDTGQSKRVVEVVADIKMLVLAVSRCQCDCEHPLLTFSCFVSQNVYDAFC